MTVAGKAAKEIRHFFCRPCAEYHEKTHPHFREAQERAAERQKIKTEKRKQRPR